MKKLAIIRDNYDTICPFGLTVSFACKLAGESVDDMQVILNLSDDTPQEEIDKIISKNKEILKNNSPKQRCKYTAHLFSKKPNMVDCDWGDSAAGLSQKTTFMGSDFFTKNLYPTSLDGLNSPTFPSEYDLGIDRNRMYGIYEWASERIEKLDNRRKIWDKLKK